MLSRVGLIICIRGRGLPFYWIAVGGLTVGSYAHVPPWSTLLGAALVALEVKARRARY
ncbi:hypothetical protein AB0910_25310 [Streptomyces sp. NPDC047002]|uniref:hypothetical protein n=1 Tax=Streptomyces sp. NPDC047002 TaxID=3155475 RepID=UPI0034518221